MLRKIMFSIFIASYLSGCASLDIQNPFDNLLNTNTESISQSNKTNEKGNFTINTKTDVDSAFAAIKNEFGFRSPDEVAKEGGELLRDLKKMDSAYSYEITPGSYYHIADDELFYNKQRDLSLRVKISKVGSGARIIVNYNLDTTNKNIKAELINRFNKVLK